jgi:hypothetical protein
VAKIDTTVAARKRATSTSMASHWERVIRLDRGGRGSPATRADRSAISQTVPTTRPRRIGLQATLRLRLRVYVGRQIGSAVVLEADPRKVLEADDRVGFFRHHDARSWSEEDDR